MLIALVAIAVFACVLIVVMLYGNRMSVLVGDYLEQYQERAQESLKKSGNPFSSERFTRLQQILTGLMALMGLLLGEGIVARIFLAGLFGACAWVACDRYLGILWTRYLKDLEEQLPDMVATAANGVKAGYSIAQALEMIVAEFSAPLGEEMRMVVQEIRVGVPLDKALSNWSHRINLEDLDIFCTALIIQRQAGGNLSEVLGNLSVTMRERRKIQGQIRTLTAQGRSSGLIMSLLPLVMFIIFYLIAPERQGLLLSRPLGWVLIGISVSMIGLGTWIISKIVKIDI